MNDDKWLEPLRILKDDTPPDALLSRILTVVPHLPQERPAVAVAKISLFERFFGDFTYGLGVKFASLCLVAFLGLQTGYMNPRVTESDEKLILSVLTGQAGLEEVGYAEPVIF